MPRPFAFGSAIVFWFAAASPSATLPAILQARLLVESGNMDQAGRLVRAALLTTPADAALQSALGDILLRRAEFQSAAAAYQAALQSDSSFARAYLGLGHIADFEFRRKDARDLFAKAYRFDPRDPEIVSALSESNPPRPRLVSKYTRYQLKLTGFYPVSSIVNGLLVSGRINGSKPLRLILDTGASGIVLDARAARDLNLGPSSVFQGGGLGDRELRSTRRAITHKIAFGDLEFEDCPIEVREGKLTPGADGVVGTNLFDRFLIRLDAASRILELTPFADESRDNNERKESVPVYGIRHLLLIRTKINRERDGLFLLDTGSAFTSISDEIARHWERRTEVPVFGARGPLAHVYRVAPVELLFAQRPVIDPSPIAFDLRQMSRQEGIEISGILGYPLLSKSTLSINYRDGIVRFSGERVR